MEDCNEDNIVDNKIEWTPFIRQLFIASGAWTYFFLFGLSFGAPTVLIPQVKRETNSSFVLTADMESWLSSTMGFSGIPWVFIISVLASLIGRKVTCTLISLTMVLGYIIFYLSRTIEQLIISQVIHGVLAASQVTTSLFITSEYICPQYRGLFFAAQLASMFWGIWVSNAIGTFMHWKNIGLFGIICSLYSAIGVSIVWPESPYWLFNNGRLDECVKSHRWLKGTGENAEKELLGLMQIEKDSLSKSKSTISFIKKHSRDFFNVIWLPEVYKAVALCALCLTTYHSSGKIVYTMYSIDIIKKITNSEYFAYVGMLILDGATVFGMYCGCFLVKHFKRRTLILVISLVSTALLYLISLYLYLIHLTVIAENMYLTISLLMAFSLAVTIGPMTNCCLLLGELLPLKSRGICVCLLSFYTKTVMAIMLKMTPTMFKELYCHGAFFVFGIFSSICIFLIYKYVPETKDKSLIEISDLLKTSKRKVHGNKDFISVKTVDDTN